MSEGNKYSRYQERSSRMLHSKFDGGKLQHYATTVDDRKFLINDKWFRR
jgi:hypothetical protein